jgi:hypothetical protein
MIYAIDSASKISQSSFTNYIKSVQDTSCDSHAARGNTGYSAMILFSYRMMWIYWKRSWLAFEFDFTPFHTLKVATWRCKGAFCCSVVTTYVKVSLFVVYLRNFLLWLITFKYHPHLVQYSSSSQRQLITRFHVAILSDVNIISVYLLYICVVFINYQFLLIYKPIRLQNSYHK